MKRVAALILSLMLLMLTLTGCNKYERDTSSGKIIEARLDDVIEMANNKETFIPLFTVTTCKDCVKLKEILIPYLEDHNIVIHEVVLDNEGTSDEEIQNNRKKINTVFPDFNSTPSMYYVEKGKVIDETIETRTKEELDAWVVKNKLDAK